MAPASVARPFGVTAMHHDNPTPPAFQFIHSLEDPRISRYRNLRERNLREEGVFIVEGSLLVERLVHSRFPVESLLVSSQSEARTLIESYHPVLVYEATPELLRQIVGFDFHRGILGVGRRLDFPDVATLAKNLVEQKERIPPCPIRLVACPGTETSENLGLIMRSAVAFGVDGLLLSTDGADPLSRRCLRQSMGSALSLPMARASSLLEELCELRESSGFHLVAAVAGDSNIRSQNGGVIPLHNFAWPARSVLIVGNEFHGLDAQWLTQCDYHVTIPLAPLCDSLNVAVATGVLLHHMSLATNHLTL